MGSLCVNTMWTLIFLVLNYSFGNKANAIYQYGHEDEANNLLTNWDLESPPDTSIWRDTKCTLQRVSDSIVPANTGNWSVMVVDRLKLWAGLRRREENLDVDTNYYYSIFLKFLNATSSSYKPILKVKMWKSSTVILAAETIASYNILPDMTDIWVHFGGTFTTPSALMRTEIYFTGVPLGVDIMYDTAALLRINTTDNWRQKANETIYKIRRNNVTITGTVPSHLDHSNIRIHVNQTHHEVGFGGTINADIFNEDTTFGHLYQSYFLNNFEKVGFNNHMKWRPMEAVEGVVKMDRILKALNTTKLHGMHCHAHSIHWNKEDRQPDWVQPKTGLALKEALDYRTNYLVSQLKDECIHFDVTNEDLVTDYFAVATGMSNITRHLYSSAEAIANDHNKFLMNEYGVIRGDGRHMSAVNNHVRSLADVPVHGLGLQNHHYDWKSYDIYKFRLDFASQNDLPLWISELSFSEGNVTLRAERIYDFLLIFFSHENVHGIIHWGFLDEEQGIADTSLADTVDVTMNEAGATWRRQVKEVWRTNEVFTPSQPGDFSFPIPAFHGRYSVKVYDGTTELNAATFELTKAGGDMAVNVAF